MLISSSFRVLQSTKLKKYIIACCNSSQFWTTTNTAMLVKLYMLEPIIIKTCAACNQHLWGIITWTCTAKLFLVLFVIPILNVPFWTKPQPYGYLYLLGKVWLCSVQLQTNSKTNDNLDNNSVSHALSFSLQFYEGYKTHLILLHICWMILQHLQKRALFAMTLIL